MKKKLILLLTCTASIFFAVAQVDNATASKQERQLWQRVEALSKAIFETKDSAALENLVNKKVTYGHSGGAVEDKATMIRKAVASKTIYDNRSFEKISVTFIKKTAIVRHTFRATSIENGTSTPLDLGILQVWIKEKGDWQIVARQAVKIAPKK